MKSLPKWFFSYIFVMELTKDADVVQIVPHPPIIVFDTLFKPTTIASNVNYHLGRLSFFKLLDILQYNIWYVQVI